MDTVSPEQRSRNMSKVRGKNTGLELLVRSLLHRLRYRFRLHRKDLPGTPDLVFPGRKCVLFLHGCFWHGHTCRRAALPTSNREFWAAKIGRNKERDERAQTALAAAGWKVLTVWQCETKDESALRERLVGFLEARHNERRSELMNYKLIDLFCGAGGMTLGFVDPQFCGGFEPVLAMDFDKSALAAHAENFKEYGETAVGDPIEGWLDTDPDMPQADVVIGGPPCQGFSLLNKKRKGDARRALWEPYLDIVELSGARMFVMENVSELYRSPELVQIKRRATAIGFETKEAVLNAADYGAPQTRKRTVVVGWNPDLVGTPDFPMQATHAPAGANSLLPAWRKVKDVIGDLDAPEGTEPRAVDAPYDLHFGRNPTATSLARYRAVPAGGNRFDLQRIAPEITPACWVRKTSGGTDLFGRLWWDRPSVTIRTEFFKPEKGRYLHPEQHRPITHREAARLMGFPDTFVFKGSKTEIARQIGNAVPPDLAGAIGKMVKQTLASKPATKPARTKRKPAMEVEFGETVTV